MTDTRGYYGNVDAQHCQRQGGVGAIAIVIGIGVGIYAFSPGARYFYRHGKLPPQDWRGY